MRICPNCRKNKELPDTNLCSECGWSLTYFDAIPLLFSNEDKNSGDFDSYLENYDQLSVNNLNSAESYGSYLRIQNDKLYSYCGDLKDKTVCEIGFGRGYLLKKILGQSPKKMVGLDISPTYIKRLNKELENFNNIELLMANAENVPFVDEFDCIVSSDVLEHVLNPGNFIFCVNQALKTNGKFIVRVPCNENILAYSKFMGCEYKFAHLRNFNKSSLKAILNNSGFKIEKIHYDGYLPDRRRSYIKKIPILNKLFDRWVSKRNSSKEVSTINNTLGRLLMKPIEIVLVCRKSSELVSRMVAPEIKSVEVTDKHSLLSWEYEHYKPNVGFEFILNIADSSGKIILSKLIGDTLSYRLDNSFMQTGQRVKATIYPTYKGETIIKASEDYYFEIQ